jgi:hypothetical protein
MDVVSTVILGVLISAIGLILGRITTGLRQEFAEFRKEIQADLRATEERLDGRIEAVQRTLDARIEAVQRTLGGRIEAVQRTLDGRIEGLGRSVDGMRSDLTQVALAVGVRPRASNG